MIPVTQYRKGTNVPNFILTDLNPITYLNSNTGKSSGIKKIPTSYSSKSWFTLFQGKKSHIIDYQ
ncbi:hypothetical protein HDF22_000270 [Mucilaginibacter lappiensis]|uniref:Uncharacterized protein n=1 Tax=Mucilaginibacter lappiensis TaxID=354630 RepID=A0A841J4N9_9SPHI|nr:hypothetical protein [Mucilaginibacter lappiensis]